MEKIKALIKKIVDYVKEKKIPVLWIIGAALLAIFMVISLIMSNVKQNGATLIDQPLTFYTKFSFVIPDTTISSLKVPNTGLGIFKVKNENENIKVESVLSSLGIATTSKIATSDIYYTWKTKNGDTITYDKPTQTIFVILTDPIEVFPGVTSLSADKISPLLQTFVQKHIDSGIEYFDTNTTKIGSGYKIEGRKKFNGYPLQQGEIDKYYDYIDLDKSFRLKDFRISIPSFETTQTEKIKLVLPVNLASAATNSNYPKIIFQGDIQNYPASTSGTYDSYLDPSLKSSYLTASSVEIVYYFANTTQQFLTPMYRVEGSGSITSNGKEYTIPIVVITSAINPDRVYIPSNIKYAY